MSKKEEAPVPIDSNKNFENTKKALGLWELYPRLGCQSRIS
jgi:hypothetical protein